MKRARTRCLARPASFAALLLLVARAPADAQLGRKSWEFFPQVGVLVPGEPAFAKGSTSYDGGFLYGFAATYHYTDHVGVELGFAKAGADADACQADCPDAPTDPLPDVGFTLWRLTGFVNSGALDRLQAFANLGTGLVGLDPDEGEGDVRLLVELGAGLRYYAWKNIALRLDAKDFAFVDVESADYGGFRDPSGDLTLRDTLHNVSVVAGISFNF